MNLQMVFNKYRNMCDLVKVTTLIVFDIYVLYVNCNYEKDRGVYYILRWANKENDMSLQPENQIFINNNCMFQNCYLTTSNSYFRPVTDYDVLLFNAITLRATPEVALPETRTEHQKYVFISLESSAKYPITAKYNYFFNWTWTYKLDSDISLQYIAIKSRDGKVIGPNKDMHWIPNARMKKTRKGTIRKLQNKMIAAAWIVTNCDTMLREHEPYIADLRNELRKYNHALNIFGECGNMNCPNHDIEECYLLLEREYYFYLSFEDSIAEDYVTDQLLTALKHFAVPLVFGGANYTRFMPNGIYLDALELGPEKLARKMNDLIKDRNSYYDMFKWHNYYSFHDPIEIPETNGICQLCALLNDEDRQIERKVYTNIVKWFNDRKDWNFGLGNELWGRKNTNYEKNYTEINNNLPTKEKNGSTDELHPNSSKNNKSQEDGVITIYDENYANADEDVSSEDDYDNGMNENDRRYRELGLHKNRKTRKEILSKKATQITIKLKPEDISIRCPDIVTCFNTIVYNIKSRLMSMLLS